MTTSERRQLERELAAKGKQSAYDDNKYKVGSTTYTIGNNSMSSKTGSTTHGLSNSKKRLNG